MAEATLAITGAAIRPTAIMKAAPRMVADVGASVASSRQPAAKAQKPSVINARSVSSRRSGRIDDFVPSEKSEKVAMYDAQSVELRLSDVCKKSWKLVMKPKKTKYAMKLATHSRHSAPIPSSRSRPKPAVRSWRPPQQRAQSVHERQSRQEVADGGKAERPRGA